MAAINAYEGPGYVEGRTGPVKPRNGVKKSLQGTHQAFEALGNRFLNACDFERTRHLPMGKGRLACDPETGEFDEYARRSPYNRDQHPAYPMAVHSKITVGEFQLVNNRDEHELALASGRWSDTPLEVKRYFKLSDTDQLTELTQRVQTLQFQNRDLESRVVGAPVERAGSFESVSIVKELGEEREKRQKLEAQMSLLMEKFNAVLGKQESEQAEPQVVKKK